MDQDDFPITADEISAYLDRELDPKAMERITGRLARDPQAALQLAAYRRRDEALIQAFNDASITSTYEFQPRRAKPLRWLPVGALLLIGALAGLLLWQVERAAGGVVLADLASDAKTAHAIYAGTDLPQGPAADLSVRTAERLSAVLQNDYRAPDLGSIGFALAGSWELPTKHGLAAVLVYRGFDGRTSSCYFKRVADEEDTDFQITRMAGATMVYRIDDRIGYAVVGPFAPEVLMRAAELGYRQMRRSGTMSRE